MSINSVPGQYSRQRPPGFTATSKTLEDGVTLVTAAGELDMATASVLGDELAITGQPPAQALVLVDFSAVTFMDSSGLKVLLKAHALATKSATRLRFYGLTRPVRKLLEITGMTTVLDIHETRDAALADIPTA